MGEIDKLKSFDSSKKLYEDRKEHVEKVLETIDVNNIVKSSIDNTYRMYKIEDRIEKLGTYLLKSCDVESERSIKYSFYRDENRYGEYAIGKKTDIVDFDFADSRIKNIEKNDDYLKEEYIYRLFDPEKLTLREKRNILKIGVSQIGKIENTFLIDELENFFEYYINKTKNGKDLLIINYASQGLTDKEISNKIKVPRRTVSEIISRVIG